MDIPTRGTGIADEIERVMDRMREWTSAFQPRNAPATNLESSGRTKSGRRMIGNRCRSTFDPGELSASAGKLPDNESSVQAFEIPGGDVRPVHYDSALVGIV